MAAGLTYAELGARRPAAGGPYVFLSETFGALWGFLYMWALVFVVMPGNGGRALDRIRGVPRRLLPLARYDGARLHALRPPRLGGPARRRGDSFAFTIWNVFGIKEGGRLNDVLTVVKIGSIVALVGFGLSAAKAVRPSFDFPAPSAALFLPIGGALAGVLWAYDGWINLSALGAEVKNPKRDIPGGLILGVLVVVALYLGANAVYLGAAPVATLGESPRAAETAVRILFGDGAARWLSLAVLVSVLGSLAANIIPASRIAYAAALDGRLPRPFARLHPRFATPAFGLMFQALFAAGLTLSGTFDELVSTVSFAATAFYALGGASIFVYRRRQPAAPGRCPATRGCRRSMSARRPPSPPPSPSTRPMMPRRGSSSSRPASSSTSSSGRARRRPARAGVVRGAFPPAFAPPTSTESRSSRRRRSRACGSRVRAPFSRRRPPARRGRESPGRRPKAPATTGGAAREQRGGAASPSSGAKRPEHGRTPPLPRQRPRVRHRRSRASR